MLKAPCQNVFFHVITIRTDSYRLKEKKRSSLYKLSVVEKTREVESVFPSQRGQIRASLGKYPFKVANAKHYRKTKSSIYEL